MLEAAGRGRANAVSGQAGSQLSKLELAVLRLLTTPLTVKEIGAELFVSENTVKTHARNIYRKLSSPSPRRRGRRGTRARFVVVDSVVLSPDDPSARTMSLSREDVAQRSWRHAPLRRLK
jgi:DNA-binding NarL/FixJ family response regulator